LLQTLSINFNGPIDHHNDELELTSFLSRFPADRCRRWQHSPAGPAEAFRFLPMAHKKSPNDIALARSFGLSGSRIEWSAKDPKFVDGPYRSTRVNLVLTLG
jgi:hypothetical protein